MSSIVHSTNEPIKETPLPKADPPKDEPASSNDVLVADYLEETGKPYIAKHLDGLMAWDNLNSVTKDNGELIDDYFRSGVKQGTYRNDDVGFKDFIRHYEKVTDVKNAPIARKINVIAEFLRYQMRTKNA